MKHFVFLTLAVAAVSADFIAPEYTVDLDKSAYDRWVPVAESLLAKRGYEYTWKPLHNFLESVLPREEWDELEPLWEKVLAGYPAAYQEEVQAFYKWMTDKNFNWTLGQIVMVQLFYEVEDACTGIAAQNSNGTIFHGRNLDYGLPGLQNFTATITFEKGGLPHARGTMYVGYFGFLTGQHMKTDGTASWSVSLNQRFLSKDPIPYIPTIEAFLSGVQNVGFFLRDALLEQVDYQHALVVLQTQHIPAPIYLVAAGVGPDEGVVITRDRNGTSAAAGTGRGFWSLDNEKSVWYRLETNFDNWLPFTDGRRGAAHKSMDALGPDGINASSLMNVLSKSPVLADDTTYTAIMINEAGFYRTIAREHSQETDDRRTRELHASVSKKMQDVLAWYRNRQTNTLVV